MIFRHRSDRFAVTARISWSGRVFVERRCWCHVPPHYLPKGPHRHTSPRRWSMSEATFRRLYRTLAGHPIKKIPSVL